MRLLALLLALSTGQDGSAPEQLARVEQFFQPYCGVERLFRLIDTFLQKSDRQGKPVTGYDATIGYPTRVVIDPAAMVSDDELSIWVRDFVATRR